MIQQNLKPVDSKFIYILFFLNVAISVSVLINFGMLFILLLFQFILGIYCYLISQPINLKKMKGNRPELLRYRKKHFSVATVYLILLALLVIIGIGHDGLEDILGSTLSGWLWAIILILIPQLFFYSYVWLTRNEVKSLEESPYESDEISAIGGNV